MSEKINAMCDDLDLLQEAYEEYNYILSLNDGEGADGSVLYILNKQLSQVTQEIRQSVDNSA